jgi:hypothetical protein
VSLQIVGTERPSSFPPLLWIRVTNQAFTPLNLLDKVSSAQLVIDGKPSYRTVRTFDGPPGIPAVGSWTGCWSPDDFYPAMTPGKHKISLNIGGAQSNEADVRWGSPVNWRKGTLETRMREVQDLAAALKKGLPRRCVEQWLTVLDGGIQEASQVRYFLEPQIKVVVPYSSSGELGEQDEVVDGPVKAYQEAHFAD